MKAAHGREFGAPPGLRHHGLGVAMRRSARLLSSRRVRGDGRGRAAAQLGCRHGALNAAIGFLRSNRVLAQHRSNAHGNSSSARFCRLRFVAQTFRGHPPFVGRRLSRPCLVHVKASRVCAECAVVTQLRRLPRRSGRRPMLSSLASVKMRFIREFRGLIYAVAHGIQGVRDGQQGALHGVARCAVAVDG